MYTIAGYKGPKKLGLSRGGEIQNMWASEVGGSGEGGGRERDCDRDVSLKGFRLRDKGKKTVTCDLDKYYRRLSHIDWVETGRWKPRTKSGVEEQINKSVRTSMRRKWTFWDILRHFGTIGKTF